VLEAQAVIKGNVEMFGVVVDKKGPIRAVVSRGPQGPFLEVIRSWSSGSPIDVAMSVAQWTFKAEDLAKAAGTGDGTLTVSAGDAQKPVLSSIRLVPRRDLPHDLWADWVYVRVLLASDPDRPDDPKIKGGFCSYDAGPIWQAAAHADLAARQGRTGRFLRLELRILADAFERMAQSSGGEAAHDTPTQVLRQAPIDFDRFMIGLLIEVDSPRGQGLDAMRLGRAIAGSGRAASLIPVLRRLAQDPDLDEWNRFRATETLVFTLAHDGPGEPLQVGTSMKTSFEDVAKTLRDLRLTPLSRHWLGIE
jgi:hypothetical protein